MVFNKKGTIKTKPAVYELVTKAAEKGDASPKNWGWHNLSELSEITATPPKTLLLKYADVKIRKGYSGVHILEQHPVSGEARIIPPLFTDNIKEGWSSKSLLAAHRDTSIFDEFGESYINFLSRKPDYVFVPAGWGLAVLEEVKKGVKKERAGKIYCTDKSLSMISELSKQKEEK